MPRCETDPELCRLYGEQGAWRSNRDIAIRELDRVSAAIEERLVAMREEYAQENAREMARALGARFPGDG